MAITPQQEQIGQSYLLYLLINAASLLWSACHSKAWNLMWAMTQHLVYNSFTEPLLLNVSLLFCALLLWLCLRHFSCVAGLNAQQSFFFFFFSVKKYLGWVVQNKTGCGWDWQADPMSNVKTFFFYSTE